MEMHVVIILAVALTLIGCLMITFVYDQISKTVLSKAYDITCGQVRDLETADRDIRNEIDMLDDAIEKLDIRINANLGEIFNRINHCEIKLGDEIDARAKNVRTKK